MSNEITVFDESDMSQLPAHLQGMAGQNDDLSGGVSQGYSVLSYKGKTWALSQGGNRTIIMRPNSVDEPASALEVVIVKANPHLSKVYYPGGYVEGSDAKPVCYSNDGHGPAADAVQPQCSTCAGCPRNAWGSRITENGSKGKECSDSRRVAVVPSGDLGNPMLLRVPAATLKDLAAYADMLSRRNAPYCAVVTRIAFDPSVAHPKFTFKALRWLSADEAAKVAETLNMDVIGHITGTAERGAAMANDGLGQAPAHVQIAAPAPQAAPQRPAPAPARAVAPPPAAVAPAANAGGFGFGGEATPAAAAPASRASKPRASKAAAAQAAPPPSAAFAAAELPPKAAPAPSKTAQRISEASADLDAALAELDD
jgi:hypothetical protein